MQPTTTGLGDSSLGAPVRALSDYGDRAMTLLAVIRTACRRILIYRIRGVSNERAKRARHNRRYPAKAGYQFRETDPQFCRSPPRYHFARSFVRHGESNCLIREDLRTPTVHRRVEYSMSLPETTAKLVDLFCY